MSFDLPVSFTDDEIGRTNKKQYESDESNKNINKRGKKYEQFDFIRNVGRPINWKFKKEER